MLARAARREQELALLDVASEPEGSCMWSVSCAVAPRECAATCVAFTWPHSASSGRPRPALAHQSPSRSSLFNCLGSCGRLRGALVAAGQGGAAHRRHRRQGECVCSAGQRVRARAPPDVAMVLWQPRCMSDTQVGLGTPPGHLYMLNAAHAEALRIVGGASSSWRRSAGRSTPCSA